MDLLERFARGDLDAFEQLFQQFHREVYGWLVRLTRDPAAAEDLTVDVFWRIYRAHATFDTARSFGAWARRIASNAALDHLRRVRRGWAIAHGAATELEGRQPVPVSFPMSAPDSRARSDRDVRVERAFLTLAPKLRIVAELALVEEMPQDEIAAALGISRSAVKSRAARALKALKQALHEEGFSE
jgi:RNA polymerase sigma factor (sigma-70 family)